VLSAVTINWPTFVSFRKSRLYRRLLLSYSDPLIRSWTTYCSIVYVWLYSLQHKPLFKCRPTEVGGRCGCVRRVWQGGFFVPKN